MKFIPADEWSLIEDVPQEETIPQAIARNVTRTGTNVAQLAGLPGTLLQTGQQLVGKAGEVPEMSTGLPMSVLSQAENIDPALLKEMMSAEKERQVTGGPKPSINPPSILPTVGQVRSLLESQFQPGYLVPQNLSERFLDRISTDIPFVISAAATGGVGPAASMLGKALTAGAAGQLAEELELGPLAEAVAGIGAATAWDLKKGLGKVPVKKGIETQLKPALEPHLNDVRKSIYEDVKQRAQSIDVPTGALESSIRDELKQLTGSTSGLKRPIAKEVARELTAVDNLLLRGEANLSELISQKQHINQLISAERNPVARNYYMRTVGALNEAIQGAKATNPELIADFNSAENITRSLGNFKDAENFLYNSYQQLNNVIDNPSVKGIFGLTVGKPLNVLGSFLTGLNERTTKLVGQVPEAREYLFNILDASFKQDTSNLIRNAKLLNKAANKAEEQTKNNQLLDSTLWDLVA